MKNKFLGMMIIALALTTQAFAGPKHEMGWAQIEKLGYNVNWTEFSFGGYLITLDNVCIAGNETRTIQPVTVCIEAGNAGCDKTAMQILSQPTSGTRTVSEAEGGSHTEEFNLSGTYQVEVYSGPIDAGSNPEFVKDYTIPACSSK